MADSSGLVGEWIVSLSISLAEVWADAQDFATGYVGAALGRSSVIPNRAAPDSAAGRAGRGAGDFVATHDFVAEAGVTNFEVPIVPANTWGYAVVNGSDRYFVIGRSESLGVANKLGIPLPYYQLGLIEGYKGRRSYGGWFVGGYGGSPIGVGRAGPLPGFPGPSTTYVNLSPDVGLGGASVLYYYRLSEAP